MPGQRLDELALLVREVREQRVREEVARSLQRAAWIDGPGSRMLEDALDDMEQGRTTPYDVAARVVAETLRQ